MDPKRVLVVDDDILICAALKKEFSCPEIEFRTVGNGRDALIESKDQYYDLVFLDIQLPDANGLDLLEQITSISPGTKIMIMSADGTFANKQRAFSSGALQFIDKPFSLNDIKPLFQSWVFDSTERRCCPRYLSSFPVKVGILDYFPDPSFDSDRAEGTTVDVGVKGLRFHTPYQLSKGEYVRILSVSGHDPLLKFVPLNAIAGVVWVTPQGEGCSAGLCYMP